MALLTKGTKIEGGNLQKKPNFKEEKNWEKGIGIGFDSKDQEYMRSLNKLKKQVGSETKEDEGKIQKNLNSESGIMAIKGKKEKGFGDAKAQLMNKRMQKIKDKIDRKKEQ